MKSALTPKEINYTKVTGQPSRFTVQGLPYEFHKPEYVVAVERQDDKKTEEIKTLKSMLADAEKKMSDIMALLTQSV